MIVSFSHINRRVRDLDVTIAFYVDLLGFYLLRRYTRSGREAAYIGLGDLLFELGVAQSDAELPRDGMDGRLGLAVTGLDGTLAGLRAKGVEVVEEPREAQTFWGRQAAIKDPDGYVIALREWRAPDGPHFSGWQPAGPDTHRLA